MVHSSLCKTFHFQDQDQDNYKVFVMQHLLLNIILSSTFFFTAKYNYSMKPCMLFLSVLLFLLTYVEGRFVVEKNSISILSPHKLRGKHDGAIGNFGLPNYGGYIVGSLVYPDKGSYGCQVFEGDKPFKFRSNRPTILLLDRGGILFFFFKVNLYHR